MNATTAHVKLPDRMVARVLIPGGCCCGEPWPCPAASGDARWAELRAWLGAGHAPWCADVLARMDELEAGQ
jgi:hypothetical protein